MYKNTHTVTNQKMSDPSGFNFKNNGTYLFQDSEYYYTRYLLYHG